MATKGGGTPYIDPDIADDQFLQVKTEDGVKVVKGVDAPGGGGGISLPTANKADGKVLKATGTGAGDNAWEDDDTTPADGSIGNVKIASDAAIAQSKLADITADDLPTIPYTKLSGTPTIPSVPTELPPTDGSVTNAKVASDAAIAQSKLASITSDDLPTIPYTKLSGTPTIPTELPPTDGSVDNDAVASDANISQSKLADLATSDLPDGTLFYTGSPSGDDIAVYNSTNSRWQLETKPSGGGGGGLTIGGTKAAGKFIQATGTGADDQSWDDIAVDDLPTIPYTKLSGTPTIPSTPSFSYEDIVRFSTPIQNSDSSDRTLPAGKSFADYDFIIVERKENPGGTVITALSPMFVRELAVGQNNEIISFPNWSSTIQNAINIDLKTNTTWRIAFIGSALGQAGEGLSALIGVSLS